MTHANITRKNPIKTALILKAFIILAPIPRFDIFVGNFPAPDSP